MKRLAFVSVGRSDLGLFRPIVRAARASAQFNTCLYLTGEHQDHSDVDPSDFGLAARDIRRVAMPLPDDSAPAIARAMSAGVEGFAAEFSRWRPDILVLLGDRYETLTAAVAGLPFVLPIAHIHGGESTEGAFDEQIRHALTKMSHIHFVAAELFARRLMQMGEEPWRITVSGAPGLDNLAGFTPSSREELARELDIRQDGRLAVVTFHPETLDASATASHIRELLAALEQWDGAIVFTDPNRDTAAKTVKTNVDQFVQRHPRARAFRALGTERYFSLMAHADVMVGNSSSGLIEAASFRLPVVNIGERQQGRLAPRNVLHVPCERVRIAAAMQDAASTRFRTQLAGLENPYGDGHAAERIVRRLSEVALDRRLLMKRFVDAQSVDARPHAIGLQ